MKQKFIINKMANDKHKNLTDILLFNYFFF